PRPPLPQVGGVHDDEQDEVRRERLEPRRAERVERHHERLVGDGREDEHCEERPHGAFFLRASAAFTSEIALRPRSTFTATSLAPSTGPADTATRRVLAASPPAKSLSGSTWPISTPGG